MRSVYQTLLGRNPAPTKADKVGALTLFILIYLAFIIELIWLAARPSFAQMPPSYYGLVPSGPLVAPPTIDNAIEPPAGPPLPIVIPAIPPPVPVVAPLPPLVTYYVLPSPPAVTFEDDPDDLTPLIVTRVILTRECFRYYSHWHCTQPK